MKRFLLFVFIVAMAVAGRPMPVAAQGDRLERLREQAAEMERSSADLDYLLDLRFGGALVLGITPGMPTKLFHFDKSDVGKLPAGWQAAHTGTGEGSVWKVAADPSTPSKSGFALAQTAESPHAYFNLCVCNKATAKDVELSVSFKAMKGKEDQGGGVVWRYQDANNYYIARMNPLEDNFRVYKVIDGKRIQLGTKEGLKVAAGEWHALSIKHVGDRIECSLDGKKHLDATDSAITTAGKVGLWSKADAQTYFDGLRMTDLGE